MGAFLLFSGFGGLSTPLHILPLPSLLCRSPRVSSYLHPGGDREWKVERENISALSAIFFHRRVARANAENHSGSSVHSRSRGSGLTRPWTEVFFSLPLPVCGPTDNLLPPSSASLPRACDQTRPHSSSMNSAAVHHPHGRDGEREAGVEALLRQIGAPQKCNRLSYVSPPVRPHGAAAGGADAAMLMLLLPVTHNGLGASSAETEEEEEEEEEEEGGVEHITSVPSPYEQAAPRQSWSWQTVELKNKKCSH
ncbi:unnamed protein product [Pleuronectes platessa]|uniref:Uncharacterized protein n=1 Tax=Pleuronectes platessa TaxID=8262 RepID=A0A9N7V1Y9_PLEPL|nr:unnamed protein product [Pleuronectes platessa]